MANFRTHISWGVFVGIGFVVLALIWSIFSGAQSILVVFMAVLIGSFLPDLDMDDGMPFQILFGLSGATISGLTFYGLYQSGDHDLKKLGIYSILVFLAVRFVGGFIFKRFTKHRGMFHSVPAAILSGLVTI
jgi:hypothetical protein